jgi:hypothetical protein
MDRSFRAQNLSLHSLSSDDGREGCAGVKSVKSCFTKNGNSKTVPHDRQLPLGDNGYRGRRSSRNSPAVSAQGGALRSYGRQQPDASLDRMVYPEPRLIRCHAVRRDLFSNFSVGEIENEFGHRQLCFNVSSTTA